MCDVRWGRGRRCKTDSTRRVEDGWQVGAMHTPVPSKRASADELSLHPARTTRNRLATHRSDAAPRLQSIKVSTRSPSSIPTRLGLGSEAGPRRRRGGGERRGTSHQAATVIGNAKSRDTSIRNNIQNSHNGVRLFESQTSYWKESCNTPTVIKRDGSTLNSRIKQSATPL